MATRYVRGRVIPGRNVLPFLVCARLSPCLTGPKTAGGAIVDDSWYKRSEFGIRQAIFFSAATVAGAFGGLLAVSIHISFALH